MTRNNLSPQSQTKEGNVLSTDSLYVAAWGDLVRIARFRMAREESGHILEPEALVNETYIKLARQKRSCWRSKEHLVRVAACQMNRILIDFARKRDATKTGGGQLHIQMDDANVCSQQRSARINDLVEILSLLKHRDPRRWRAVALTFAVGLSIREVAKQMGYSTRTVKRDLRDAYRWLGTELGGGRWNHPRFLRRNGTKRARVS